MDTKLKIAAGAPSVAKHTSFSHGKSYFAVEYNFSELEINHVQMQYPSVVLNPEILSLHLVCNPHP